MKTKKATIKKNKRIKILKDVNQEVAIIELI